MKQKFAVILLGVIGLTGSLPGWSMPEIQVNGLFGGSAVLVINGKQHLLKQGQTSPEGVTLLESNSQQAVLLVDGKRLSLGLSDRISASFHAAEKAEVRIPRAENGHYYVSGYINGRPVDFMVDTGASAVAMNMHDARRLGVNFRRGIKGNASTAGGIVNTYHVDLDKLSIGNIAVHQVRSTVVIGNFPAQVLLGNSFLSQIEMSEEAGVLVMRKKY
ncbi:TIGR02281 family clan AA aspartic protease [Porticoccus hydrocarbonoclasticus]|uniref:TIGR02281 family clan AA aspartic protease n=1 Tax=Porticoccus hydrocarbonoclasticus TaxID=1073414 RepID=UPI001F43D884|nr:TIGR02281 family clan AA aspartic protease [Porticoccus hydrocarbonoclasticus]|tara:strand:+ start:833 stop:1483 length:651 start_codon:yes stop_codon:yes gene_type:complete